ncbi:MAG: M1 family aminopeptidase, partial [Candidatus Acidiferrales bacterium]
MRRDVVSLTLFDGELALFAPIDGKITGAVFAGRGRIIALPPDPAERRSIAHFLTVPLLDQAISRAYLRFTDDTAKELLSQLKESDTPPISDPGFVDSWKSTVAGLNPEHSLRVMADLLSSNPLPYFYAGVVGDSTGAFDVLVDDRRDEQVLMGQPRISNSIRFYDVWASFHRAAAPVRVTEFFEPISYLIDTSIAEDRSMEGKAVMKLRALRDGERMISLELSRFLEIQSASDADGHPLDVFQNEAIRRQEIGRRGNDAAVVFLPEESRAGKIYELHFTYRGGVIGDAGNGVFFVGARGSWYPHPVGTDHFATFDLAYRWPRRLVLVSTGEQIEQHEEGEWRVGHWHSATPVALAGFNLGEYATSMAEAQNPRVDLYANRQLEMDLLARLQSHRLLSDAIPSAPLPYRHLNRLPLAAPSDAPPPSPAAILKQLGDNISDSIRFFEKYNGPFPFSHLAVSQIPGSFGQGWPGLLYLSTLVFLSPDAQARAGVGNRQRETFTELVPFHEVAHQWWGNQVGIATYRDSWIEESMANYLALLYADSRHPQEHVLARSLEQYRAALLEKEPSAREPVEDAGPLSLGFRLSSSKSPDAYDKIIYGKGTWVIHMLRMMLMETDSTRESSGKHSPAAKDSTSKEADSRFIELLHAVLTKYRFQSLSTADFQHVIEQSMPPEMDVDGTKSLDWFFDEWVRGTGIPRYSVSYR